MLAFRHRRSREQRQQHRKRPGWELASEREATRRRRPRIVRRHILMCLSRQRLQRPEPRRPSYRSSDSPSPATHRRRRRTDSSMQTPPASTNSGRVCLSTVERTDTRLNSSVQRGNCTLMDSLSKIPRYSVTYFRRSSQDHCPGVWTGATRCMSCCVPKNLPRKVQSE